MFIYSSLKGKAQGFLDKYKKKDTATYAAAQQAIGGLLILDGFVGIDHPFDGKKRPGIFGTISGMVIGVVFIFIPVIVGNISGISKMTATTTATVVTVGAPQTSTSTTNGSTSTSTTCSITAKYTVAGREYTNASSSSSSGNCNRAVGSALTINYNPNDPASWSSDAKSIGLFLTIFKYAGVFIVITSFFTFLIRLFSIIFGWKLLRSGRKLAATLPSGTDLGTVINQIKTEFKTSLFNFSGGSKVADIIESKLDSKK